MNTLGHLLEQAGSQFLVGGEFLEVDGDQNLLGLCINISNIDTTFVSEQNPITLC